jgi:MFS family permease
VGIGGVLGALSLAAVGHRIPRMRLLSVTAFAYASLLVAFAVVRDHRFAYPILLGAGFMMIATNATSNSTLQHIVPNELRGRVMAVYSFVVVGLSQVVGSAVSGMVARASGTSWAIGGSAAAMLAFAYQIFYREAALREMR